MKNNKIWKLVNMYGDLGGIKGRISGLELWLRDQKQSDTYTIDKEWFEALYSEVSKISEDLHEFIKNEIDKNKEK